MRLRPWLYGGAAWLALAAITAIQNYVTRPFDLWTAIWRELLMFGAWAVLTPAIVVFAQRTPSRLLHIPGVIACSLAHNALLVAARYAIEDRALPPFTEQLWALVGRSFILDVVFYLGIVVVVEAVRWWNAFRARDADLARARLDALASQLQPHFLFNALHAASSLIDTDPPAARKTLVRLSDLLRATLDVKQHTVPLSEELALLELYLDIQRIRFHDRLTVTIDVSPDAALVRVPPLLLQPLVENAIRHGIAAKPDAGTITISARRDRERVRITVADDGVGLSPDHDERIGLGTTRARLEALFPDARLELHARAVGTEAVIEVPA